MFSRIVELGEVAQYHGPHILPIALLWIFLCGGGIKHLVYETLIDTREELDNRLAEAAAIIRETTRCLERVRQSLARRCQLCINVQG